MKDLFSWRLTPSENYLANLWENAIFVFDTNFLLDLYRRSESTSKDYLNILENLAPRMWLPYQVVEEFLGLREVVFNQEAESFQKAINLIDKWKNDQLNFRRLKDSLTNVGKIVGLEIKNLLEQQNTYQDKYQAVIEEVEEYVKAKIHEISDAHSLISLEKDYKLDKILELFDEKVGQPFDIKTLNEIYQEGEERYKKKKPPGFKDNEKEDILKYGDLIIWKEIIKFAKEKACPIVFVTGDTKEDWWVKKKGSTVSPYFDLRREFHEQVNQPFWMYETREFLKLAKENLKINVSPSSIEEANTIAEVEAAEEISDKRLSQAIRQIQRSTLPEYIRELSQSDLSSYLTKTGRAIRDIERDALRPIQRSTLPEDVRELSQSDLSSYLTKIGRAIRDIERDALRPIQRSTLPEDVRELSQSDLSSYLTKIGRAIRDIERDALRPIQRSTLPEDVRELSQSDLSSYLTKIGRAIRDIERDALRPIQRSTLPEDVRELSQSDLSSYLTKIGRAIRDIERDALRQNQLYGLPEDVREIAKAVEKLTEFNPKVVGQDNKLKMKKRSSSKKSKGKESRQ